MGGVGVGGGGGYVCDQPQHMSTGAAQTNLEPRTPAGIKGHQRARLRSPDGGPGLVEPLLPHSPSSTDLLGVSRTLSLSYHPRLGLYRFGLAKCRGFYAAFFILHSFIRSNTLHR